MCDIKVVNPAVLKSIESFMNDSAYREALENSTNYNTRLCIERRLRMPFLDSQTGLAQNHCNLFMTQRQRMPGLREGQIYTYPSKPWRKKRRQYLMNFMSTRRKDNDSDSNDMHTICTVENPALNSNDDSKDSSSKDETSVKVAEAWYYDEMDMHELDGYDEPDADSDMDYEEPSKKRKGKRGAKMNSRQSFAADSPNRRGGGGGGSGGGIGGGAGSGGGGARAHSSGIGRGRRKNMAYADLTDSDKPFSCDRASTPAASPSSAGSTKKNRQSSSTPSPASGGPDDSGRKDGSDDQESNDGKSASGKDSDGFPVLKIDHREKATPSPYCDFCLGDAVSNKKSGQPEELVSCSDCGRSGHPTCLQFTNNMIVSVRKYRWQCIECKCCSICGNSDNDDQLLFCDDCDRGYHMYCLTPPLSSPPEGSWSCRLCLREFHSK